MNAPARLISAPPPSRKQAQAKASVIPMPLMPSLQRRRLQCYLALMASDIAALFAGFALAGYLRPAADGLAQALLLAQLLLPVCLTVALYNGAYAIPSLARPAHGAGQILQALAIAAIIVVVIHFCTKSGNRVPRLTFTLGTAMAAMALVGSRLWMRGFVRWRCGASVINELVIDDGGPPVALPGAHHVRAAHYGLEPSLCDPVMLDRIGLMMRNADRVIVSTPPERRADWAIVLKGANVSGEVIDENVGRFSAHSARTVVGQGLLQVSIGPLGMRARLTKRLFDLMAAGVALFMLAPLLAMTALAIKLEDGGPVFFVQRRVGRGNRFFAILKFRSMTANRLDRDGTQSASKSDARVTRVGRFIRATSIDELPQLINVLYGNMSLVGPRPHAIGSQAGNKPFWEVDTRYWQRHALKPGLTGLAQIRGLRGATEREEDLASRLNADLEYLDGWSLWRDLWIIFSTFRVLIHDRAF